MKEIGLVTQPSNQIYPFKILLSWISHVLHNNFIPLYLKYQF